ncbi:MAG: helix-turn-helix domain-containing protein [Rhodothermales bacterium]
MMASAFARWTTDEVEASDRFDAWHVALNDNYGGWSSVPTLAPTFSAVVECGQVDAFRVIECVCDPCGGTRNRSDMVRDQDEFVALQLVLQGREEVSISGEAYVLNPGDILVWDTTRPMSFRVVEQLHKLSVMLPLARLRNWLPNRWEDVRRVIQPQSTAARLLGSYLQALAPRRAMDGFNNSDALIETTIGLLVNALEPGQSRVAAQPRELQLERVRNYIDEHLTDPDLSPGHIAAANRISVRYLHWLFETLGTSVSQYVIRERLERCHRDLGNPLMAGRKVSDIAFSWGFNDVTHFSRRFRQEYGMSPRSFAKMITDGGSTRR